MSAVSTYNNQQLQDNFSADIERIMKSVELATTFDKYESVLSEGAMTIGQSLDTIGSETADFLSTLTAKDTHPQKISAQYISYSWMEEAKSYLILWRDVLLQQQKAQILELDGQVDAAHLQKLKAASKEILGKAGVELQAQLSQTTIPAKQVAKWNFQANPWPLYKDQIKQLTLQCSEAEIHQNGLQNTTKGFHEIRAIVNDTIRSCELELGQLRSISQETMEFIKDNIEEKPNRVASRLEELEGEVRIPAHFTGFSIDLEEKISNLAAKMQVPIDTNGGLVQFKEANFKKNARQWLDSEILPLLSEIWELTEGAEQNMKMSLVNIRNRVVLLSNEDKEGLAAKLETESYCQPLEAMLKKIDNWLQQINELENLINERLDTSFKVSKIYDTTNEFLPVSLQSTLTQLTSGQNELLQKARTQLSRPSIFLKRFRDTVTEEGTLSDSEKIVRTIQDRNVPDDNSQYTSIFQTKGYIGESFWVGRKQELQRVRKLYEQWQLGYRGAILLSGNRFSGKSLFGDLIANHYFPKKTVRLTPNTKMNKDGRKWDTSYDLKESLNYIKKIALQEKVLIWIDDLELWQSPTVSLGQNIRSLQEHIDLHGTQLFYMVSMSTWLESHLQKTNTIRAAFQAVIHLDKMSVEEIQQAILIRHGATHKVLVADDGEEISPEAFNKMTSSICSATYLNIGDALNRWAASIRKLNEEQVIHERITDYPLPNFLSSNGALLLATIFKEKRTNEYRLRRLFGIAFKEKYSSILQRFISMGILIRQLDGMLELNESIANDLGRMLERSNYL